MFAEDDIDNISKPVRTMYIILPILPFVIMNSVFSRVSAHEKKVIRQLESIGKDVIRTNAAVTFISNLAALRAAVFTLSSKKNLRGAASTPLPHWPGEGLS